jgi:hypothetical protein
MCHYYEAAGTSWQLRFSKEVRLGNQVASLKRAHILATTCSSFKKEEILRKNWPAEEQSRESLLQLK